MKQPKMETIKLADLVGAIYNPREITDEARAGLAASIERWGLVEPLVINKRNMVIIGGHRRYDALKAAGVTETECVVVDLPEIEEKALNVSLNNPKIQGTFTDGLSALLAEIALNVDIPSAELQLEELLKDQPTVEKILNDADGGAPVPKEAITKPGDLWILGDHRLICGDSANLDTIERLMNGKIAQMLATDPPYGVEFGKKNWNPTAKTWEPIANDEMKAGELREWLAEIFIGLIGFTSKDGAFYVFSASLFEGFDTPRAMEDAGIHVQSQIIWAKNVFAMGQCDYQWKHEPIWYGFFLGENHKWVGGRDKTTVWNVDRDPSASYQHPTQKPVELFATMMRNSTDPGDICLEPFSGSGSQILAAEQTNRKCYACELSPNYCDVAIARWEKATGKKAVLDSNVPALEAKDGDGKTGYDWNALDNDA